LTHVECRPIVRAPIKANPLLLLEGRKFRINCLSASKPSACFTLLTTFKLRFLHKDAKRPENLAPCCLVSELAVDMSKGDVGVSTSDCISDSKPASMVFKNCVNIQSQSRNMRISSPTVFPSNNGGLFTSLDQSVDPCGDPVGLPEAVAVEPVDYLTAGHFASPGQQL
jgi:hypothetical protein